MESIKKIENIPSDLISRPWKTEESTIANDIIEFRHSFGYNCKKLFNLVLIDPNTLVFSSGNLIHYLNISTREVTFRRTVCGGGVGFILKNPIPKYNYLTIGENGDNPLIFIYKYPDHQLIAVLEGGAVKSFTTASYNHDGELLASQAGYPDYMLTIWKWKTSSIILRAQSFQNDVLNVIFSPFNPILLTTCGLGHIKCWKMANTFTGLKLQGELGRFGKTEICDIFAVCRLADEQVLSGCEWGNILVWDAGLIKVEVCRKGRRPCHTAPITKIYIEGTEIVTVGMDGYVCYWFWETVELADPPDDDRFVEIDPIYEYRIGDKDEGCEVRNLIKAKPNDPDDFKYYAQDGNGGIWECSFGMDLDTTPARKIYSCHGGRVIAGAASPTSPYFMTFGDDGRMSLYNYEKKLLVLQKQYTFPGCDVLWLSLEVDPSGSVVLIGFGDGVLRQLAVEVKSQPMVYLIKALKPHASSITKITMSPKKDVLVTGSTDKTVFIFSVDKPKTASEYVKIVPVGFVNIGFITSAFNWNPVNVYQVVVGGSHGEVAELTLSNEIKEDTTISYNLQKIPQKKMRFASSKSEIRRQIKRDIIARRKQEKKERKMDELEKLKKANPGIQVDEEAYLQDSDEEEEEEPLFIPKVPNPVLWLQYTPEDTIWLSMGGFDAGYIYEYSFDAPQNSVRATIIADGDDIEIHSFLYIEKYLIFGMEDGRIRVNATTDDYLNLSDYWILSMHSNLEGVIPTIFKSYDGRNLFSVGQDGSIFVYQWNGPSGIKLIKPIPFSIPKTVSDIDFPEFRSLEQQKIKEEEDRQERIAISQKEQILTEIAKLQVRFNEILQLNEGLPESQKFSEKDLELDSRITSAIVDAEKKQLDLLHEKFAFEVEKARLGREKVMKYFIDPVQNWPMEICGLRSKLTVKCFRVQKLDEHFDKMKEDLEERIRIAEASMRIADLVATASDEDVSVPEPPDETFFHGVNSEEIIPKFSKKMLRLLNRYRTRQVNQIERFVQWKRLNAQKPDINKNHADDEKAIIEAERTIGDYKLKTDINYESDKSENLLNKFKEIMRAREELFDMRNDFNQKLFKLREERKNIYDFIAEKKKELNAIHQQIPEPDRRYCPDFPESDKEKEYPEKKFIPQNKPSCGITVHDILYMTEPLETLFESKEESEDIHYIDPMKKIMWHQLEVQKIEKLPAFSEICAQIQLLKDKEADGTLGPTDPSITLLERRYQAVIECIVEQDEILTDIDIRIGAFDEELQELADSRLEIERNAKYLELYIITRNQELLILKDCEMLEKDIVDKTNKALNDRNTMSNQITALNKQIEDSKKSCDKMADQIKACQNQFMVLMKGNKFFDFLKRIFKKKYKPPRPADEEYSDESSSDDESSTEEEEDEAKSMESMDMQPIRLDENFCPPGCDKKLYDLSFSMRTERQSYEQGIINTLKLIEEKKKEMEEKKKDMAKAEEIYSVEKGKLTEFRRKKQTMLNKVESVVILKLDQMQYMKEGEDINDIRNTLLFDRGNVTKLYERVGELENDTLETKRFHKINIIHLQRMNTDIKCMKQQIAELEASIKETIMRKFGIEINMDELEKSTLRQYVFDLKTDLKDERKSIDKVIDKQRSIMCDLEQELIKEVQNHTDKKNILIVLQEEKNFLTEVLKYQDKLYEKNEKLHGLDILRDLEKLKAIEEKQVGQIKELECEIRTLRVKGKPLQVQEPKVDEERMKIIIPEHEEHHSADDSKFSCQYRPLSGRGNPDDFKSAKVLKLVQKFFVKHFNKTMSEDNIRKYSLKVSTYLGYIANNFELDHVTKLVDCIIENLQTIVPKKYLILVTPEDIQHLYTDIACVFDLEKSTVNVEELLTGIVANASEAPMHFETLNQSQVIMTEIFKEMIEIFSPLDLESFEVTSTLTNLIRDCKAIEPKCINLEILVEAVCTHAKENMIDDITQTPIRRLAKLIMETLLPGRKQPTNLN